jgi:hypothetical protein
MEVVWVAVAVAVAKHIHDVSRCKFTSNHVERSN